MQNEDQLGEQMLDREQAAQILGVTPETLRGWAYRRKGPRFYRFEGRVIRYRMGDLRQFIEKSAAGPA